MGSIEVKILGQTYSIKGDADTQYITQLADFVDMKTKEVLASAPGITPLKAAILAAINIADELHRLRQSEEELAEGIEEKAKMLSGLFD
jgi:cell division protein ZapA